MFPQNSLWNPIENQNPHGSTCRQHCSGVLDAACIRSMTLKLAFIVLKMGDFRCGNCIIAGTKAYWSVLLEVQELEIAYHFCFSKLEFFDMRTNFLAASCCKDVAKACELWIAYLKCTLIYWEYIWNSNCFTFQDILIAIKLLCFH
jgi:hypothetical protein